MDVRQAQRGSSTGRWRSRRAAAEPGQPGEAQPQSQPPPRLADPPTERARDISYPARASAVSAGLGAPPVPDLSTPAPAYEVDLSADEYEEAQSQVGRLRAHLGAAPSLDTPSLAAGLDASAQVPAKRRPPLREPSGHDEGLQTPATARYKMAPTSFGPPPKRAKAEGEPGQPGEPKAAPAKAAPAKAAPAKAAPAKAAPAKAAPAKAEGEPGQPGEPEAAAAKAMAAPSSPPLRAKAEGESGQPGEPNRSRTGHGGALITTAEDTRAARCSDCAGADDPDH